MAIRVQCPDPEFTDMELTNANPPLPRTDLEHSVDTYTHIESLLFHPETKNLLILTSSLTGDFLGGKIFLLQSAHSSPTPALIGSSPIHLNSFVPTNAQRTIGGNTGGCWISATEFAASSERGTVEVWQEVQHPESQPVPSGDWTGVPFEAISVMYGHDSIVSSVQRWSADPETLVTSSLDGCCLLWSLKTYLSTDCYRAHLGPVQAVSCQPDGTNVFMTGAADRSGPLRLWDRREKLSVGGVPGLLSYLSVCSLAWGTLSPNMLVIGTETGHLVTHDFRNLNSDVHLLSVQPHSDVIRELAFCPTNESLLATASHDNTAGVVSVDTGELVAGPFKHSDMVPTVEWYPQSSLLLSAAVNCQMLYSHVKHAE